MPAIRINAKYDVYTLKAKLQGAPKPIWRRILIPGVMTLHDVHWVLAEAFGWPGQQIYQFRAPCKRFSLPEFAVDELLSGLDPQDSSKARLYKVAPEVGTVMHWDYRFDEAWTHRIVVEMTRSIKNGDVLPRVLDGNMAVPPSGCGGMMSYCDMVYALADPEHEQHEYWTEWAKGKIDSKPFRVADANERLKRMQAEVQFK